MNFIVLILSIFLVIISFKSEVGLEFSWLAFLIPAIVQLTMAMLGDETTKKTFLIFGFINLALAIILGLLIMYLIGLGNAHRY